jgi:hypothetical protein
MNEDILVKLTLVRYALLPRQLLAFDEAYGKDCHEFRSYFFTNSDSCLKAAQQFLEKIESGTVGETYIDKCVSVVAFARSLPFVDSSSFVDLSVYNPFDDFESYELECYLLGQHIPEEYEVEEDEASIFYSSSPELFYDWYKHLENKTLTGLLRSYIELLQKIQYGRKMDEL